MLENYPRIAISNRMFNSANELIDFSFVNDYKAIDYSFNAFAQTESDLAKDISFIEKIIKENLIKRFHCPFLRLIDLAHIDDEFASRSLRILKFCVDITSSFGGKYVTVHVGLGRQTTDELSYERALFNLSELVDYANKQNIIICLENLRTGWTNNPESFLKIIENTGSHVTFDLGHANGSPWVINKNGTSVEFLRTVLPYVRNAHVYEIEEDDEETMQSFHVAPQKLDLIIPMLNELINTQCDWWVVELHEHEDVNNTRALLYSFLEETLAVPN